MDNASSRLPPPSTLPSFAQSLCPTFATHFLLPSLYILLFLTALPGNALSLWVFWLFSATKSTNHVYMSHLSVSNLLLSLTTPFLAAYFASGSAWPRAGVLCLFVVHGITPMLYINIYISLMIMTWVALSRFATLIQHTHASRPSSFTILLPHSFFTSVTKASFATKVCATVWVVTVGSILPVTVFYSVNEATSGNVGKNGESQEGGGTEDEQVCYNEAVEIGGNGSKAGQLPAIVLFYLCFLMVLLSYMIVLKHIRRSRSSTTITASWRLLGRVQRNIVVIQVILTVCLLPYHIFKPIFNVMSSDHQLTSPGESLSAPGVNTTNQCHPLSQLVELKNSLVLLAALRSSTDPVMYFLLDKTFRKHIVSLLTCPPHSSAMAEYDQRTGALRVTTETPTGGQSHERDL
ncbi:putative G-protein coupled receptor 82 [Genypterus blacodes]|uniref:putative G-protein coupled receptor 82 n=1 Tax=Genypterus blacodes TaxID=154954 RepID=UPI003F7754AF